MKIKNMHKISLNAISLALQKTNCNEERAMNILWSFAQTQERRNTPILIGRTKCGKITMMCFGQCKTFALRNNGDEEDLARAISICSSRMFPKRRSI